MQKGKRCMHDYGKTDPTLMILISNLENLFHSLGHHKTDVSKFQQSFPILLGTKMNSIITIELESLGGGKINFF